MKKTNYKFGIFLEEWSPTQGFQTVQYVALTEQCELDEAVLRYQVLKGVLEQPQENEEEDVWTLLKKPNSRSVRTVPIPLESSIKQDIMIVMWPILSKWTIRKKGCGTPKSYTAVPFEPALLTCGGFYIEL